MKSSRYIIILLIACACNKQLNVLPTTSRVDGNVIVDQKSAQIALNGVYYHFAASGVDNNDVPAIRWYEGNETIPSQLAGMMDDISGIAPLSQHIYNAQSANIDVIWTYGYTLLNTANGFIKNLATAKNIPDSIVKRMNSEALFLRAFANSRLLFTYGQFRNINSTYGIILRNEFVDATTINLPRSTVADTYTAILTDLDNAIAGLPNRNTTVTYANVWSAKLLKARVLMNRGIAADLPELISLTTDIISNSGFALEPNVKDVFLKNGAASTEVMQVAQPFPTQTLKYSDYIFYVQHPPSLLMQELFNGDPRSSWMMQSFKKGSGTAVVLGITKYYPGSITVIAPAAITENAYAMRLTEAYLLQAEALLLSGANAKDALKIVLTHAGVTDFDALDNETDTDSLHLLIIKEFMKNFVGESGQDWDAVRRLPFATLQTLLPTVADENQLVLPVPDPEIIRNREIRQNPGY